jgi:alginate O-acetyltransferase complex protein AlgI
MIFTELRFLLLFAACWLTFALVPRRLRMLALAFWGVAFYFVYAGSFVLVAALLTALVVASRGSVVAVRVTGAIIIALLIVFKQPWLSGLALGAFQHDTLLVPLGYSYLAFELLHVLIERHRKKLGEVTWSEMFAFAFFAPSRIAGPIKRLPAFRETVADAEISISNVYAGLMRILLGLAKKFLLADLLALTANESRAIISTRHAWTVLFAYAFQLLLDFSAYTDIAIGFARMLGIRLPENFNYPYLSRNIREFWERWHITLSRWVRDYVFTPLARRLFQSPLRKHPIAISTICYLVTFGAVGAWHGLSASFIAWGLYHGILLAAYNVIQQKLPKRIVQSPLGESLPFRAASIAFTFTLAALGFVFFMQPMKDAVVMLGWLFGVHS